MICTDPDCKWPALVQGIAEEVDGEALAICIIILRTAESMDTGTFARACRVARLSEATTAELVAELVRRGKGAEA